MTNSLKTWLSKAPDLSVVIKRFPIGVIAMGIFTLIIIFIGFDRIDNGGPLARLCLGLVIGGYVSVSMTLANEGQGKARNIPLQAAAAIVIAVLSWFSESLRINLPMAIGASILVLGNAVRWRRVRDDLHVWDFTHKLWTGVLFAAAGSVIFLLGLLFISEALKTLFGIRIDQLLQDLIWPIGFGFFAPLYWLSTLPPANEDCAELNDNPSFVSKAVAFLGTWLLAPLTLIYALILLAYGVKIGLQGSLPKGEIAVLTLPFLIIGTLTWLALEPPFIRARALAKLFRRLWFPLSIPAAVLLAIAVFVRIREYGYTPERFALMVGVLWAMGLGLWFTFGPNAKRDIRIIPGSAAGLLVIGTFTAGWLSVTNQAMRLEDGLKQAGIMSADGSVNIPDAITDLDAARKAKGALKYLWENNGEGRIDRVLGETDIRTAPHGTSPVDDMHPQKTHFASIEAALGLDKVNTPSRWSRENEISYNRTGKAITITGFDKLHGPINLYHYKGSASLTNEGNLSAKFDNGILVVSNRGEDVARFNAQNWIDEHGFSAGQVSLDSPYIDILSSADQDIRLAINSFSSWTEGSDAHINMDIYILTRGLD